MTTQKDNAEGMTMKTSGKTRLSVIILLAALAVLATAAIISSRAGVRATGPATATEAPNVAPAILGQQSNQAAGERLPAQPDWPRVSATPWAYNHGQ